MYIYTCTSVFIDIYRRTCLDMHGLFLDGTRNTSVPLQISVFPVTSVTPMVGNWGAGVQEKKQLLFTVNVFMLSAFFITHMYRFFITKTYFKRERKEGRREG